MRLHFDRNSSCSRRVTITVALLGIDVEERPLDLGSAEDCAALRKLNPAQQVPVLEDGSLLLWESHAIMLYLCNKTPGQRLYPSELGARADVDRWLFWISAQLEPAVRGLNIENMWKKLSGQGQPDAAFVMRLEVALSAAATVLDDHLANRRWISGHALSLADISVAATLMYREPARLPLARHANLIGLLDRVGELDAWERTDRRR
jgi:glutathione S-transferase